MELGHGLLRSRSLWSRNASLPMWERSSRNAPHPLCMRGEASRNAPPTLSGEALRDDTKKSREGDVTTSYRLK